MDAVIRQWNESLAYLKSKHRNFIINEDGWNKRKKICFSCDFCVRYNNSNEIFLCKKCGCNGIKFMLKNSKCPLKIPKWS